MAERPRVVFEPLGPQRDRAAFESSEAALDGYLRRQATQDIRRGTARVFVAIDPAQDLLVGYYRLSAASCLRDDLPEPLARQTPALAIRFPRRFWVVSPWIGAGSAEDSAR
jgi:hypothetical protein